MDSSNIFGTDYNPAQVMMRPGGSSPYLGGAPRNNPTSPTRIATSPLGGQPFSKPLLPTGGNDAPPEQPLPDNGGGPTTAPQSPFSGLPGESIRATGPNAGYDSAYRQNLASYAGGQFMRPGGALSFNPTGPLTFGNPTGAGNDPVLGMPTTLLAAALGGNPFLGGTINAKLVGGNGGGGGIGIGGGGGGSDPTWWQAMMQGDGRPSTNDPFNWFPHFPNFYSG